MHMEIRLFSALHILRQHCCALHYTYAENESKLRCDSETSTT